MWHGALEFTRQKRDPPRCEIRIGALGAKITKKIQWAVPAKGVEHGGGAKSATVADFSPNRPATCGDIADRFLNALKSLYSGF